MALRDVYGQCNWEVRRAAVNYCETAKLVDVRSHVGFGACLPCISDKSVCVTAYVRKFNIGSLQQISFNQMVSQLRYSRSRTIQHCSLIPNQI